MGALAINDSESTISTHRDFDSEKSKKRKDACFHHGATNSRVIIRGDSRYIIGALLAGLWEADDTDIAVQSMFF
jgi:hypothetical protein